MLIGTTKVPHCFLTVNMAYYDMKRIIFVITSITVAGVLKYKNSEKPIKKHSLNNREIAVLLLLLPFEPL